MALEVYTNRLKIHGCHKLSEWINYISQQSSCFKVFSVVAESRRIKMNVVVFWLLSALAMYSSANGFVHCWFCVSESYLTVISLASFWITIWFTLSARHSSSSVTGVLTDQTGKIMKKNISITKEIKNTENNTKRDRKTRVESAISVKPNWSLKYRPRYEFSRRRIQQCFWRTAWKSSYCGGTKALSSRLGFA